MKLLHIAFVVLAGLSTASCTLSEAQYESYKTMLEGSGSARRAAVEQCVSAGWSKSARQNFAVLMDVSPERASKLACQRLTSAIASGRLKYADLKSSTPSPALIKVLQGR